MSKIPTVFCRCPFCGAEVPHSIPYSYSYAAWRCDCGALACGSDDLDIDEAADQLLSLLKIEDRVGATPIPVGRSGTMTAVPYDANKTLAATPQVLERHGFDTIIVEEEKGARLKLFMIWARLSTHPKK